MAVSGAETGLHYVATLFGERAAGEQLAAFSVPGEPQPWTRPTPVGEGRRKRMVFLDNFAQWRQQAVAAIAAWWAPKRRPAIRVPVVVHIVAVFRRPARAPTSYTVDGVQEPYPWSWAPGRRMPYIGTCDWDNLGKALCDVLQMVPEGTVALHPVLANDKIIVAGMVEKWYARDGEPPHTEVRIWRA